MTKISALSDIGTSVASNDTFVLVDVSDPTTPNKKIQQQNLFLIPDGSAGTPGLRFLSDTNVGVFRPTTDTLAIATGGSERLRIDSSGRLGLGTSSPSELLTVGGATVNIGLFNSTPGTTVSPSFSTINFYGFSQDAYGNIASISAGNSQTNEYGGVLRFSTNTTGATHTERMRIDSSGNVGIGTTSPSAKLHVATAGNNYIVSHNTTGSTSALLLGAESGSTALYSWTTVGGSTGVPLKFVTGASEAMRLDTSGRLLVGTSSAPPAATSLAANLGKADTSGAITSTSIGESHRIFHGFVPASTSTAKTTTATFQFATAYGAALIEIDIVGGLAQVSIGRYLLMVDCDTASGQTAQLTGGSSISAVLSSGWNAPVFTSSGASSTPTFTVAFTRATGVDTEDWTSWLKFTAKITSNNSSAVCTLTTLATS